MVRGWIDEVGDLDVLSRGPAWAEARRVGRMVTLEDGTDIAEVDPGVTIGNTWRFGPATIDEMIDTAEIIDGIPCVRLGYIEAYMRLFDRPKDRIRLEIIVERSG